MTDAEHHAANVAAFQASVDTGHVTDLRRIIDKAARTDGPGLIELASHGMMQNQADLARASGLTANTITAIKRGKRPTAAQRAAIYWAIAVRLNLS